MNRRTLLVAAASVGGALALAACATTSGGGGLTFATIKTYAADAVATLEKLAPLVAALDPGILPKLQTLLADAQAALQTLGSLSDPTGAATTAQAVLTAVSDAFVVISAIPGLPPAYIAAIGAAQILLVALGGFFGIQPSPSTEAARLHPGAAQTLWSTALRQYTSSSAAAAADARVRIFLGS